MVCDSSSIPRFDRLGIDFVKTHHPAVDARVHGTADLAHRPVNLRYFRWVPLGTFQRAALQRALIWTA